jgi:hypothetical protein
VRLYSERLPLRTTAAWDSYRETAPIPHRYGETAGRLLQYDSARRVFVWADHPCRSVDEVTVDEIKVGGWRWFNAPDSTGRAVCFVELAEAPADGAIPRARGRGKLSTVHGDMITNPADVLHDLLANIGGKDVASGALDLFRRECQRADLTVAGSFESDQVSLLAAAREVCGCVGAAFAPDAAGLAFLEPGGATVPARETIDARFEVTGGAALSEMCNDLTIRFDFDDGEPRQAVQLECPAAVARQGRRPRVMDARWLTSARIAVSVGTRLLRQEARPVWDIEADGIRQRLRIGHGVALDHARFPITGTFRVLSSVFDPISNRSAITFRVPAGAAPSVELVRQSARLGPQIFAGIGVETVGTERVLTLLEENGAPISGADVTLNGATTRQTDGGGRVTFPASSMPRGEHTLAIATRDGRKLTTKVQVT